jgi:HCOMODA/2-hydroxy-3-carboxy-muconic semialdehyde decarboxylase
MSVSNIFSISGVFGIAISCILPLQAQIGRTTNQPKTAGAASPSLIEDLVAANRILAAEGIVEAYGHVSVRHDRDPSRYLMARSVASALVTTADIMEYDLDSRAVEGNTSPSVRERYIHGEIYKARPDVMAVVHSHAYAVIPFTVSSVPLRAMFVTAGFIGDGLPIFEIRDVEKVTNLLVENEARGRGLALKLADKPAVLMRGHGAAVVGPSLKIAVGRSVYLNVSAKLQAEAIRLGGTVTYMEPEEARASTGDNFERAWDYWKRRLNEK